MIPCARFLRCSRYHINIFYQDGIYSRHHGAARPIQRSCKQLDESASQICVSHVVYDRRGSIFTVCGIINQYAAAGYGIAAC